MLKKKEKHIYFYSWMLIRIFRKGRGGRIDSVTQIDKIKEIKVKHSTVYLQLKMRK